MPVRDGSVTLAVAPWGEVYVDGAARGVSPPLTQLSLPPGAHTIEIRNTTFPAHTENLDLKARDELTVRHKFQ